MWLSPYKSCLALWSLLHPSISLLISVPFIPLWGNSLASKILFLNLQKLFQLMSGAPSCHMTSPWQHIMSMHIILYSSKFLWYIIFMKILKIPWRKVFVIKISHFFVITTTPQTISCSHPTHNCTWISIGLVQCMLVWRETIDKTYTGLSFYL